MNDNPNPSKSYLKDENQEFKKLLSRFISFWPIFLVTVIFFFLVGFAYLRYAQYEYKSFAKIQIIDEAQDSEMALPSALTVFNRSMVNLENESSILMSYSLNSRVVKRLNSNIKFYIKGNIKSSQKHPEQWFKKYDFKLKIESEEIKESQKFSFSLDKSKKILEILEFDDEENLVNSFTFNNFSTFSSPHNLPFDIRILEIDNFSDRTLTISPLGEVAIQYKNRLEISPYGKDSEQLDLAFVHSNKYIAEEYLNTLLSEFDKDGIVDRQLEYKNTIEFVDKRSVLLSNELEVIELRKQNFKRDNNLSDLKSDASINIQEKYQYNNELFVTESQQSLAEYLLSSITENDYDYIPLNIGFDDFDINSVIGQYNQLVSERNKYLTSAGLNNSLVKGVEKQLDNYKMNIEKSIANYLASIKIKIDNLKLKEIEFLNVYNDIPENEKVLRSIERELNVKEALFLLLLQKREEAAINFAVVKPTIKIIDYAISGKYPIYPNKFLIYGISLVCGILFPLSFLYMKFFLDNKIHIREDISEKIEIPIIAEVPYIDNSKDLTSIVKSDSRNPLSESLRILIANLKFASSFKQRNAKGTVILVTSSIKGEGKTLISSNTSSLVSSNSKVLLIGADLRNPQIHKIISKEKNIKGLSDILYKNDISNYKNYLVKEGNLEVLLSGTIPPNPSELLASSRFENFIEILRKEYDYIFIDSAPCLLVSDTFEISKLVDISLYVIRSNFSSKDLLDFISENQELGKLKNMNLILNSVGNSSAYGYKYGYQYGYKYGYKYGYNYGYGYGYSAKD